jgi:hypothetical protein
MQVVRLGKGNFGCQLKNSNGGPGGPFFGDLYIFGALNGRFKRVLKVDAASCGGSYIDWDVHIDSVGNKGDYYYVSVAGSTNLNGITDWQIGDLALFNGTIWQKIDNTDAVQSVNGQTGIVVLDANSVGATANTTYVLSSGLLTGGGRLNANVTVGLTSVPVANVPGAVPNTVNVLASGLLTGGGPLTSNVTIGLTTVPIANVPSAVPNTVNVLAGGLLTGGGNLSANVTISLANVPNANVTGLGNMALQNSTSVTITGGNVNVQTTNMTSTTSSSATFATSSLLLVPAGFFSFDLNGTVVKVPYYAV